MGSLPDTHTHLADEVFAEDRDSVMERAVRAGVRRVLAVGSDLATSKAAVACAHRYEHVYAAVGLHPHQVGQFDDEAEKIKALLDDRKVVAVGEIGIDRIRAGGSFDEQVRAFRAQLSWASERDLPVSVHNRNADDDILSILREYPVTAVLHCFSGSPATAEDAINDGHFISFAGNVTFPNAVELREAARGVPMERLVIETDSPVLSPQPWRGRRNEPAHVVAVCEVLEQVRGSDRRELADRVWETAARVFGWGTA